MADEFQALVDNGTWRFRLWLTMVLGALFLGLLELMWVPASGFSSINFIQMVLLHVTKLDGLFMAFLSSMA